MKTKTKNSHSKIQNSVVERKENLIFIAVSDTGLKKKKRKK